MTALAFPDPALTDRVVLLREWRECDVHQRQEGFADPLCQRFSWPGTVASTPEDTVAALARDENERLAGTALSLAVTDAS